MSKYSVEVKPSARKELDALPDAVLARMIRTFDALREVPRPAGCKKLKGYKDHWRIRISDWRAVYLIDETAKRVSIVRIAHRRHVYD